MSTLRVFASFALCCLALSSMPRPAAAAMGGPGVCGTMCMAQYNGMFSPFVGNPMFPMSPGAVSYYQTGQWGMPSPMWQDPRQMMAMSLNWNGAQPLGLSYMPPIGMPAIYNSMAAGAMGF